jgi:hypothetical protein
VKALRGIRLRWNQFFGGLLIGAAFGLLIGAAVVRLPEDGSGKRQYPIGPSVLLALVVTLPRGAYVRDALVLRGGVPRLTADAALIQARSAELRIRVPLDRHIIR